MSFAIPPPLVELLQSEGDHLRDILTHSFRSRGLLHRYIFSQIGCGDLSHLSRFASAVTMGPHAALTSLYHQQIAKSGLFYESLCNPLRSEPYFVTAFGYATFQEDISDVFLTHYIPRLLTLYPQFAIAKFLHSPHSRWHLHEFSDSQIGPVLFFLPS